VKATTQTYHEDLNFERDETILTGTKTSPFDRTITGTVLKRWSSSPMA